MDGLHALIFKLVKKVILSHTVITRVVTFNPLTLVTLLNTKYNEPIIIFKIVPSLSL